MNQMNQMNRINQKLKTLPSEILTLICSFGYPEYKEHIKEITNEIINQSGLLEYNTNLLYEDYFKMLGFQKREISGNYQK